MPVTEHAPDPPRTDRHRLVWLVVAITALSLSPWLGQLDPALRASGLALGVVVAGLPHGALDPLVAHATGRWQTATGLIGHLCVYLGLAGAVVLAWLALPVTTLAAFLLLSAWHFSGDWPTLPNGIVAQWNHRLALGLTVVAAPALFHPGRVGDLFAVLTGSGPDNPLVAGLVLVMAGLAAPAIAMSAVIVFRGLGRDTRAAAELALLPLLAWSLPPLVYFAVYFCLLHSPRHLLAVAGDSRIRVGRSFWLTMIGLTATAAVLGASGYLLIDAATPDQGIVQVVFIGLAALTVPHMLLIERFARAR